MKYLANFFVLLLLSFSSVAFASCDGSDKAKENAFLVLHAVDWWQTTKTVIEHPDQFNEANPIIGSHPSKLKFDLYMTGAALLQHNLACNYFKKGNARNFFQNVTLGIKIGTVYSNWQLMAKTDF